MHGIILIFLGTLFIITTRVIVKIDLRKTKRLKLKIDHSFCMDCTQRSNPRCEQNIVEQRKITFHKRFRERFMCYIMGISLIEFGMFNALTAFVPEIMGKHLLSLVFFINALALYTWSLTLRKKSPETDAYPFGILLTVYAGALTVLSIILQV